MGEDGILLLSQTQQIDSISDRHKRMAKNNQYHQFKKVIPTKGLPLRSNTNQRRMSLDDKMSQFAFGGNKTSRYIPRKSNNSKAKTTTNPRKRPRSTLLPNKPSQSVDYRDNNESVHSSPYHES